MSFRDYDKKTFIADTARAFSQRRIGRRSFMSRMAMAGVGFSGFAASYLGGSRPFGGLTNLGTPMAMAQTPDDVAAWLRDAGRPFAGTTVRYTSEATPPTVVASELKGEFEELTGINVEIEIVPLEQVLAKATLDAQGQLGTYDLYYLDQAWSMLFKPDVYNPREYYDTKPELAMPGYDWDDFSPELVKAITIAGGEQMGVPFDIPIYILMYRKDLYDKHGLTVPKTLAEFMEVTKALHEAESGNGIYGTTGQLRSGHYSLNCDWTAWLWANGGSVFNKDRMFSGGDEAGMKGLAFMQELVTYMPEDAKTWTWDGQGQSVAQGLAGHVISWGEFFPGFDGGDSRVAGLMEAAIPPEETALRSPEDCGFNEIPHIGHQGGSSIALSRYSQNPDAAWLFMQWVTSKDVVARSSTVGGGASPVRLSSFKDPRVLEAAKPGAGTTRHFPAIEWTINNRMGSEPSDLPSWAEIANNVIPVELGKLLVGQTASPEEAMAAIARQADDLAAPFRG